MDRGERQVDIIDLLVGNETLDNATQMCANPTVFGSASQIKIITSGPLLTWNFIIWNTYLLSPIQI